MSSRFTNIIMALATWGLALGPLTGCDDGADGDGDADVDGDSDVDGDGDADVDGDVDSVSPVVDTGQTRCYSTIAPIACPESESDQYYGQDAFYLGNRPSYTDNGDGTVSDNVTGLMWIQEPMLSSFGDAESACADLSTGGHDDWRVPSIREMYSLINFDGDTGTAAPEDTEAPPDAIPYIDTEYFTFYYGTELPDSGNRYIDSQYISTNVYTGSVMGQGAGSCFFGVNLADGRIKCYPTTAMVRHDYFLRCVRGSSYGSQELEDNGDGTITDHGTWLTWLQQDSGGFGAGELGDGAVDWLEALAFCEGLDFAGHDDWRLPDAKELQSLVDYSRSPDATSSPAIDPLFETTQITNEAGQADYPYVWSSTTHLDGPGDGENAAYVSFGRAMGQMEGVIMDVHGAGAQRSDPKVSTSREPTCGMGPQGDCRRTYNYARCVRGS